eukprot:g2308.t1
MDKTHRRQLRQHEVDVAEAEEAKAFHEARAQHYQDGGSKQSGDHDATVPAEDRKRLKGLYYELGQGHAEKAKKEQAHLDRIKAQREDIDAAAVERSGIAIERGRQKKLEVPFSKAKKMDEELVKTAEGGCSVDEGMAADAVAESPSFEDEADVVYEDVEDPSPGCYLVGAWSGPPVDFAQLRVGGAPEEAKQLVPVSGGSAADRLQPAQEPWEPALRYHDTAKDRSAPRCFASSDNASRPVKRPAEVGGVLNDAGEDGGGRGGASTKIQKQDYAHVGAAEDRWQRDSLKKSSVEQRHHGREQRQQLLLNDPAQEPGESTLRYHDPAKDRSAPPPPSSPASLSTRSDLDLPVREKPRRTTGTEKEKEVDEKETFRNSADPGTEKGKVEKSNGEEGEKAQLDLSERGKEKLPSLAQELGNSDQQEAKSVFRNFLPGSSASPCSTSSEKDSSLKMPNELSPTTSASAAPAGGKSKSKIPRSPKPTAKNQIEMNATPECSWDWVPGFLRTPEKEVFANLRSATDLCAEPLGERLRRASTAAQLPTPELVLPDPTLTDRLRRAETHPLFNKPRTSHRASTSQEDVEKLSEVEATWKEINNIREPTAKNQIEKATPDAVAFLRERGVEAAAARAGAAEVVELEEKHLLQLHIFDVQVTEEYEQAKTKPLFILEKTLREHEIDFENIKKEQADDLRALVQRLRQAARTRPDL